MLNCYLMQGIPGSGKSTLAKTLGGTICSADDYFYQNGVYKFDREYLPNAHQACMKKFITVCNSTRDVVVDNTNISLEEMIPYVRVAQAYGYGVIVHTITCSPQVALSRGLHGVPSDVIIHMYKSMTYPPKHWGVQHKVYTG